MNEKRYLTASVKMLEDAAWPHGSFEATLSAPELDRDGEIIDTHAFHPLPPSIPIFGDHVATIATTVARAVPQYEGNNLVARGRFGSSDYAQLCRTALKEGLVDTMSVGFMVPGGPDGYSTDDKGIRHLTAGKGELLEASFVPIPSLRQATVSLAKGWTTDLLEASKLETKAGARNSMQDQKMIQTAHDALVNAGAECDSPAAGDDGTLAYHPPHNLSIEADVLMMELGG